ncbi:MAG TPA: RNA polymerase sigma-70 factor [bacterium]|nr:RNA polymerase sigma-70 factor [bacterium]
MHASPDGHAAVFQEHRPLLFSLAYRMVGSAADAEDIVQDAYVRFQPARLETIESPKAFLSAIVMRLCLNHLTSARVRRETYVGPWLPEPVLDATHPELAGPEARAVEADTNSLAFLVLLERLTPAERAVFLLREVFEYEYDEIAQILERSEAACRKLFSRARDHIAQHRPRFQASPEEHRRLLEQFMRAARTGDLNGLMTMLADDVTIWADGGGKVPGAALRPVHGPANVARFLIGVTARFAPADAQYVVADVNGRPTLLVRRADGTPVAVVSIEVEGGRIGTVWAIGNPDKLTAV